MARYLYLESSKMFISPSGQVISYPNSVSAGTGGRPRIHTDVPDWVTETQTYKIGVQEGSILDVTPTVTPAQIAAKEEIAPTSPEPGTNKPRKPKAPKGLIG